MDPQFIEPIERSRPPQSDTSREAGSTATREVPSKLGESASSPATIQRNEKSAELLTRLATPSVGEGPAIEVQTELVNMLEELIEQAGKAGITEFNLGGILFDRLPDVDRTLRPAKEDRQASIQA